MSSLAGSGALPHWLAMRLASHSAGTGWSELSLGHLIQQSGQGGQGHARRGTWLGQGFYGHTEGWAVVRAAQGLLVTTTTRAALGASVQSTQMDAAESVAQLKAARQLGETLSQSARQQGAQGLHSMEASQALQQHTEAMDPAAQGKYTGAVGGQQALKAQGRTLADPVERFDRPQIHLDTPVSASWVTPAHISLFSGQDTSLSVQGDVHVASAHVFSSVSGQTTSLYTHAGGIKAIAANGPLSLRAHTDAQQIWSEKDLTVQSTTDEIRIQAKDSITLTAGSSQVKLQGGNVTFTCPGTWTVKGASHAWSGGGSRAAQLTGLPDAKVGEQPRWLELELRGWEATPLSHVPYEVTFSDGSKRHGTLDANGFAHLDGIPKGLDHKVAYKNPATTVDPDPYTLSDLATSIKTYLGV